METFTEPDPAERHALNRLHGDAAIAYGGRVNLTAILLVCGALAPIAYIGTDIAAGLLYPAVLAIVLLSGSRSGR